MSTCTSLDERIEVFLSVSAAYLFDFNQNEYEPEQSAGGWFVPDWQRGTGTEMMPSVGGSIAV